MLKLKHGGAKHQLTLALIALSVLFFLWNWNSSSPKSTAARAQRDSFADEDDDGDDKAKATFLYFAYASDLVESRLKAGGGPSAIKVDIGKIKGRKLAFSQESKVWRGGVADIVPSKDSEVWGVVYKLNSNDLATMDKQKGLSKSDPLYERLDVNVELSGGSSIKAITYGIVDAKRLPFEAAPTPQYKDCIIRGAEEHELPSSYLSALRRIKDNGSTYKRKNTC